VRREVATRAITPPTDPPTPTYTVTARSICQKPPDVALDPEPQQPPLRQASRERLAAIRRPPP